MVESKVEDTEEVEEIKKSVDESNTKADILTYVRELEEQLAQAQLSIEVAAGNVEAIATDLDRYLGRTHATMPDKIADWLEVSSGKAVDPENVMVMDLTQTSVFYKIKGGLDSPMGIHLTTDGSLVDPPVHQHSWVRRGGPGGAEFCLCGKRLSDDGRALSVEEQADMARGVSAEATRVAVAEEEGRISNVQVVNRILSKEEIAEFSKVEETAEPELNE